ncbi:MAG TPA: invasion associated locus B family protein [Xanthobacteraceae bacterium]|nr:invasion associated locus B family protein [Xanthobacteraceae bacterium]
MRKVTWLLALGMATAIAGVPPAYAQGSKQVAQSAKPDSKTSATSSGAASGAQPSLLGQYGDWGAYTANPNGRKICFALSKPQKATTDPPNRPRDPAYMFISTRPAEKVTNEVSIVVGYGQKANSEAVVDIGGTKFAMYTQNDGAWIKNAAEEPRLVEALRKGADVVVHGESARGTKTTDTYSLKGLTQALERVSQECK